MIFGSVIAYSAYLYALGKLSAGKLSSYAYVNPAIAVVIGAIILRETVTLRMVGPWPRSSPAWPSFNWRSDPPRRQGTIADGCPVSTGGRRVGTRSCASVTSPPSREMFASTRRHPRNTFLSQIGRSDSTFAVPDAQQRVPTRPDSI